MADIIPHMDWSNPDKASAMRMFQQRCELYFSVKGVKKEKEADHILLFAGEQGIKTFNSWGLSDAHSKDSKVIWSRFLTQVEPKTNHRVSRFYLQRFRQKDDESIDDFMSQCRLQAFKCDFRDDQEFT